MAVMLTAVSVVALLVSASCEGLIRDDFVPKCRGGVCDDRPECPISDCTCIFPSQVDCAVYYRCKRGKPYQDRCSPGLLMNPLTLTCDYENNVNCSSIVRTTASSSSTSVATPPSTSKPTIRTTVLSTTVTEPPSTSKPIVRTTVPSTSITTLTTTTSKPIVTTTVPSTSITTRTTTTSKPTVTTTVPSSSTSVTTPPTTQETTFSTTPASSSLSETSPVKSTSVETTENTPSLSPNITHFNTETTSEITTSTLTSTNEIPSSSVTDSRATSTEETTTKREHSPSTNFIHSSTVSPTKYSIETHPSTRTSKTTYSTSSTANSTILTTFSKSVSPTQIPSTTPSPSRPFECPSYYGLFPDPENCRRFYHCSHNIPYHKWCPSNLHFNPQLLVCDWPRHAGCELFSTTQQAPTTPNLKTTTTARKPTTLTTTVAPLPMNQTCDCDCCILPVAGDCTEFILCMGEVPFQMSCLHGLFFNPMTSTCDKPENVDCKPEPQCPERNGRFPYPDSCTYYMECKDGIKHVKKCPEGLNYDDISKTCSWTGTCGDHLPPSPSPSNDTSLCLCDCCFLPDPDDCAGYTKCWNGEATKGKCADGLLFNIQTENCDYDHNVQCPAPSSSPECPANFGVFQYPGQCNLYIQCVEGRPNIKKCPGILHFSEKKKSCDWPWSAGCHDSHQDPTSEPNPGEVCECDCCFIPDGRDCSSFTLCVDGVGKKETCSSGLLFNAVTENCDFEENVQCNDSSDSQGLKCPEYEGLFPHPNDCDKFIHCAHGHPFVKVCPSVLHFNPVLKVCDWPYSAGCMGFPIMDPRPILPSHPCDICDSCFIPDRYDCAAYTVCNNGTAFEMRCADGLFFNQDINNCDYSDSITCPDRLSGVCPKHFGLFQVEDCSKFMHCSHGIAYIKDCPSGLHFNQATDRCDYPCDANCDKTLNCVSPVTMPPVTSSPVSPSPHCNSSNGFFANSEDCSTFYQCSNGSAYLINCPHGLHFNKKLQWCDEPCSAKCDLTLDCHSTITTSTTTNPTTNITPSIYCKNPNGLFPSPEDCGTFFKCSNGYAYLSNCPYGLHFNENLQQCDEPCIAKCDLSIDCPSTITTSTNNPTTTVTPSIYCKDPSGLFPNPEDCETFYQCNNGYAYRINCPYGLHFNANLQRCDEPCAAKCDLNIDCHSTITTTTTNPTTNITPSIYCKNLNGLFPNPEDCETFFQCSNGYAHRSNCPYGLHFSENLQQCDEPCTAKCDLTFDCPSTVTTSTNNPTTTVTPSIYCKDPSGLFPNPEDCETFYQCNNGYAYRINCPYGLHFNANLQRCDEPCAAKCNLSIDCHSTITTSTTTKPTTNIAPSIYCKNPNGLFPNPEDCGTFFQCSNGYAHRSNCPYGLHFNENLQQCDEPCTAKCDLTFDCSSPVSTSTTSIKPVTTLPHCKLPNGLFSNPDDCSTFYQCSNGYAYLMNCPYGLHFNENIQRCDEPCNAKCDINIACPNNNPEEHVNCTCDECLLPDLSDCSAYYYCKNYVPNKEFCPYGMLFSKETYSCDIEDNVECIPNGDPALCLTPTGMFSYPEDCHKFVHCDSNIAYIKKCPDNLRFNVNTSACDYPDGSCGPAVVDPNCLHPTGLFPHNSNCTLFYHCDHGVAYLKTCPAPLYFNPSLDVCDWPWHVNCGKAVTDELTSPAPTDSRSKNYETTSIKPIQSSTVSSTTSTTTVTKFTITPTESQCHTVPGVTCPCACRVPTYDECNSFYQCQTDGTACKKFCPEGLYFNKRIMMCDLPENVQCREFYFAYLGRHR